MNKLKQLHDAHANSKNMFADPAENKRQQDQINMLTKKIHTLFKKTESQLKRVTQGGVTDSNQEKAVKMNLQRSLAIQLQNLSVKFRKDQKRYMDKLENLRTPRNEEEEDNDLGFTDSQNARAEAVQIEAVNRRQEIEKIAKGVEELATLFKDLATLVIDQGTLIDRIDYNLEEAAKQTEKGVQHLVKAEQYQKQSNRVLYCMVCLLAVIATLIGLIIWKFSS